MASQLSPPLGICLLGHLLSQEVGETFPALLKDAPDLLAILHGSIAEPANPTRQPHRRCSHNKISV
jgi:hypothetical protein